MSSLRSSVSANLFSGHAVRVNDNGLGFDQTRLGSQSDNTDKWVDPVAEVLAFFGLALLPVRGDGIDRRQGRFFDVRESQRGWLKNTGGPRERRFMWGGLVSASRFRRHRRPDGPLDTAHKRCLVPDRGGRGLADGPVHAKGIGG